MPMPLMSSKQNLRLYHIYGCQIVPEDYILCKLPRQLHFWKMLSENTVFEQVAGQKKFHKWYEDIISPEVEDPVIMALLYLPYEFLFTP